MDERWVLTGSGTMTTDGRVTGVGRTGVAGRALKPGEQVAVVSRDGIREALDAAAQHPGIVTPAAALLYLRRRLLE